MPSLIVPSLPISFSLFLSLSHPSDLFLTILLTSSFTFIKDLPDCCLCYFTTVDTIALYNTLFFSNKSKHREYETIQCYSWKFHYFTPLHIICCHFSDFYSSWCIAQCSRAQKLALYNVARVITNTAGFLRFRLLQLN